MMALSLPSQSINCDRCSHGYSEHRPVCKVNVGLLHACDCPGFRWVDPAPTPDVVGYHRPAG